MVQGRQSHDSICWDRTQQSHTWYIPVMTLTSTMILYFSRVSAHLCVSAHPPFLMILYMVHVYMRYAYKWLVCVSAHPRFFAHQLQAPMGAYLREYGTCMRLWRNTRVITFANFGLCNISISAGEKDAFFVHIGWQTTQTSHSYNGIQHGIQSPWYL